MRAYSIAYQSIKYDTNILVVYMEFSRGEVVRAESRFARVQCSDYADVAALLKGSQ